MTIGLEIQVLYSKSWLMLIAYHLQMALVNAFCSVVYLLLLLLFLTSHSKAEEDQCRYELNNIPYIMFNGQRLPDHAYIDIALLGDLPANSLQCHTDLSSCCGDSGTGHSGEWFLPNGLVVGTTSAGYSVRENAQRLDLLYEEVSEDNGDMSPRISGIYRCALPTTAENDIGNTARASVHVGLYAIESKLLKCNKI